MKFRMQKKELDKGNNWNNPSVSQMVPIHDAIAMFPNGIFVTMVSKCTCFATSRARWESVEPPKVMIMFCYTPQN